MGYGSRWFGDAPRAETTGGTVPHPNAKPAGSSSDNPRPSPQEAAAAAASQRLGGTTTRRFNGETVTTTVKPGEAPEVTRSDSNISPAMPDSGLAIPSLIPLHAHEMRTSWNTHMPQSHLWQPTPQPPDSEALPPPRCDNISPARIVQTLLPPNLTDEQLALMDQITREAIDERLRILEGVSVAVSRCVEDLTRVRSALPDSSGTRPVTTETQSHDTPPSTT